MDLREKKTIRSIENAFLQLRAKKPLERITVKELVRLAEVSKSTFYLHYEDVYDLSDKMQKNMIEEMFDSVQPEKLLFSDCTQLIEDLFQVFAKYREITEVLFSERPYSELITHVEYGLKERIFREFPDLKDNSEFNLWLSYSILGGYAAYAENGKSYGDKKFQEMLAEASEKNLSQFFLEMKNKPSNQ